MSYFIIRSIGSAVPTSMYPFASGLFTLTTMIIYFLVTGALGAFGASGDGASPETVENADS